MPDDLRKNIHLIILGALAFGIGGYPLGIGMYQEGSSLVFIPAIFFLVATFWGLILGLLTKNLKNALLLSCAGLFGGFVSMFIANLGGLIIMALMGWLLILTPLVFLGLAVHYYRKKENIISCVFFLLFCSVALDWVLTFLNQSIHTQFYIYSLHAFVFTLIGLIVGCSFGLVIGRPSIMSLFGAVGFLLGSYWIGILYRMFDNSQTAVFGFIITYILVSVTAGIFLVIGLYFPEKKPA